VDYWPFIADWATYLACGIRLHLNSGAIISFLGTYYTDSRYCGGMQRYDVQGYEMVSYLGNPLADNCDLLWCLAFSAFAARAPTYAL